MISKQIKKVKRVVKSVLPMIERNKPNLKNSNENKTK
jgi:hypothetical protein